jgi:site-specific DNA-methyltransferase (adenine-specific)
MTTQSSFVLRGRNPDILTCIANLSSDEVFTPPELATRMLTTLAEAWAANNDGANRRGPIWAGPCGLRHHCLAPVEKR